MSGEFVIEVNDENFEREVLKADGTVLVDFWAPWCGPCKMLSPIMGEIAQELKGKIKVCSLNVDEAIETARNYRVMNIPTIIFFKGGQQIKREVGARPKEEFVEIINSL